MASSDELLTIRREDAIEALAVIDAAGMSVNYLHYEEWGSIEHAGHRLEEAWFPTPEGMSEDDEDRLPHRVEISARAAEIHARAIEEHCSSKLATIRYELTTLHSRRIETAKAMATRYRERGTAHLMFELVEGESAKRRSGWEARPETLAADIEAKEQRIAELIDEAGEADDAV